MDYQRKKLMTQSVAFLQAHLKLCETFLEALARDDVLTREEVSTVQKDATPSGKVLELVCIIKRKDLRTFNKFLEILDANDQKTVSQVLQRTGIPSDMMTADPRTMNVLENHLPDAPNNILQDLCAYLVPSEVYHDDIRELQGQIRSLQGSLAMYAMQSKEKSGLSDGAGFSGRRSGDTTPASGSQPGGNWPPSLNPQSWDAPPPLQQHDELLQVLRQKDAIIQRKDDEYAKLRKILQDTQNDMQGVLDLNSQYLAIIGQLNQMQALSVPGAAREHNETMMELEQQMQAAKERIEQLQIEVEDVSTKLSSNQNDLDKVLRREKKYKEMLGLETDADEATVTAKIQSLLKGGKMSSDELEKIRKELVKTHTQRENLEEKVTCLEREKEKVEFHMRQQDLTVKRMSRQKTAIVTVAKAQYAVRTSGNDPRLSTQLRLPAIQRPPSGIALTHSVQHTASPSPQYCMFCRAEFMPLKSPPQQCRVHYRPIRRGRYTCCKDDCHRSAGCLQLPHFYLEITIDRKCFLTDGARYMEITPS